MSQNLHNTIALCSNEGNFECNLAINCHYEPATAFLHKNKVSQSVTLLYIILTCKLSYVDIII